MKDYTLDNKDKKTFILKYEIIDDKIVVYFANGEKCPMAFSKKNEQKILEKMNEQVECYSYPKKKQLDKDTRFYTSCMVAMGILMFYNTFNLIYGVGTWINLVCVGVCCSSMVLEAISVIRNKSIKKDIEKSDFVLENSEVLNKKISDNKSLVGVNNKTLNQVKSTPEGRDVFDINSIDSMSLNDLKKIKTNIEKNSFFGVEDDVNQKESVKVLGLKKK